MWGPDGIATAFRNVAVHLAQSCSRVVVVVVVVVVRAGPLYSLRRSGGLADASRDPMLGAFLLVTGAVEPVLDPVIAAPFQLRIARDIGPLIAVSLHEFHDQGALLLGDWLMQKAWAQLLEPAFAALLSIALVAGPGLLAHFTGNLGPRFVGAGEMAAERVRQWSHHEGSGRSWPLRNGIGSSAVTLGTLSVQAMIRGAVMMDAEALGALVAATRSIASSRIGVALLCTVAEDVVFEWRPLALVSFFDDHSADACSEAVSGRARERQINSAAAVCEEVDRTHVHIPRCHCTKEQDEQPG